MYMKVIGFKLGSYKQNFGSLMSHPDSRSDPIGGSEPISGCETIY